MSHVGQFPYERNDAVLKSMQATAWQQVKQASPLNPCGKTPKLTAPRGKTMNHTQDAVASHFPAFKQQKNATVAIENRHGDNQHADRRLLASSRALGLKIASCKASSVATGAHSPSPSNTENVQLCRPRPIIDTSRGLIILHDPKKKSLQEDTCVYAYQGHANYSTWTVVEESIVTVGRIAHTACVQQLRSCSCFIAFSQVYYGVDCSSYKTTMLLPLF